MGQGELFLIFLVVFMIFAARTLPGLGPATAKVASSSQRANRPAQRVDEWTPSEWLLLGGVMALGTLAAALFARR